MKRLLFRFLIWLRRKLTTHMTIDKIVYSGRSVCLFYFRVNGNRYMFSELGDFTEEFMIYGNDNVIDELSDNQYGAMATFILSNQKRWKKC